MNWNPALLSEVQQVDSQMGSQLSGSPRNSTKPPIRLGSDFVRENPTIFFHKNDIFMTIFHDIPLFEDVFSLQNKIFAKKGNLSKKKQAPRVFRTFFILKIRDLSLRELGERWFTWDVIDAMLYTYGWWKTFRGHLNERFYQAIELECMFCVFLMFRCSWGTNASGKSISSHPCKVLFSHRRGCEWCTCGGLENC